MGTHSRILAWRIPWTEEPGGLQSMALQRVEPNWRTKPTHKHCQVEDIFKRSCSQSYLLSRQPLCWHQEWPVQFGKQRQVAFSVVQGTKWWGSSQFRSQALSRVPSLVKLCSNHLFCIFLILHRSYWKCQLQFLGDRSSLYLPSSPCIFLSFKIGI